MLVPLFQILLAFLLLSLLSNFTKVSIFLYLSVFHADTFYFFLTTMHMYCSFSTQQCFCVVVSILDEVCSIFRSLLFVILELFFPSNSSQLISITVCKAGYSYLSSFIRCSLPFVFRPAWCYSFLSSPPTQNFPSRCYRLA